MGSPISKQTLLNYFLGATPRPVSTMTQQPKHFLWKIGAPAGLGVMTTGLSLSKLATRSGYHIFDYAEYPSLIKGGHNTYEVNISKDPVRMIKFAIDCLVCFNEETFTLHNTRITPDTLLLYDPGQFEPVTDAKRIPVPFQELLAGLKADKIMVNMISLGASFALLGGKEDILNGMITDQFKKKGDNIVELNITCARTGFEYVKQHFAEHITHILTYIENPEARTVLAGNDSFALGAVAADCRFYAAYPMSPSSSVLEILAGWQHKTGMVVRHAEDEIGVVNETLGASFAGVRAATGSSGGGFALMAETLSYAGIAEQPLVVFVAQRPGPATGMPTWTEQGDLLFTAFAGHGEFPKIVLAPGDPEEMLDLTMKAFDLADIYQTPVIVLSDKVLSESHYSVPLAKLETIMQQPINRGKTITEATELPYHRYVVTEDGISPRLIPGQKGVWYQANSYEHFPDSHTTEDAVVRKDQVDKRARKVETYFSNHFSAPTVYGDLGGAQTILFSWGGNKGAILDALEQLGNQGNQVAYIHFTHVYPLHTEAIKSLFGYDKPYILIENNSTGQFGLLLKMATGFDTPHKLLKYDGRPVFTEEVVAAVHEISSQT